MKISRRELFKQLPEAGPRQLLSLFAPKAWARLAALADELGGPGSPEEAGLALGKRKKDARAGPMRAGGQGIADEKADE